VTYAEHIEALAREHEIVIHRCEFKEPCAEVWAREVWVPYDLDNADNYLAALHEIAHVVADVDEPQLLREWAAWEWAYAVALPVPHEALLRTWTDGLGTYFEADDDEAVDQYELRGKRA
jgi:hypothetical protein